MKVPAGKKQKKWKLSESQAKPCHALQLWYCALCLQSVSSCLELLGNTSIQATHRVIIDGAVVNSVKQSSDTMESRVF